MLKETAPESKESFVRWQAILREQLSYAVNLFSDVRKGVGFCLVKNFHFACRRCAAGYFMRRATIITPIMIPAITRSGKRSVLLRGGIISGGSLRSGHSPS